jgi:hypothetical protein
MGLAKFEYNAEHPYFFWIPILLYMFARNLTPWLRRVHLPLLAAMGKITLETYLMQHHIWLTSNAKTLLVVRFHVYICVCVSLSLSVCMCVNIHPSMCFSTLLVCVL